MPFVAGDSVLKTGATDLAPQRCGIIRSKKYPFVVLAISAV